MKIESIDIRTVMGARSVSLHLATPIIVLAGGNGSGKSSVLESVRIALGEDPLRVSLKKEYGALVTEGAKNGRVTVVADGESYGITFPDGKRFGLVETSRYLPFVLDPARFAKQDEAARRTILFDLTGCRVTGERVAELLDKRGCNAEKSATALQRLDAGFPAAVDFAKEQARYSKASWRAITGEAWGTAKAASWKAEAQQVDTDELKRVGAKADDLRVQVMEEAQNLGQLREQHKQYRQWKDGDAARKEQIARLPSLRTKLEHDEKELQRWSEKVQTLEQRAGTGPRVGLVHDLARMLRDVLDTLVENDPFPTYEDARAALRAYEAHHGPLDTQADPEAQAQLPEAIKARDLMQRAVENARRDIVAAELAASLVDSLDIPEVGDDEVATAEGKLQGLRRELELIEKQCTDLGRAAEAAKVAQANTERAAQHSTDIDQWLAIAEALSPEGIPGEILSAALAPMNDRLRESAAATGWKQVNIGADMVIAADGRPYPLLCESEKWRADAMIAEAISHLAGLKMLLLDRADVLEPAARPELLGWLDELAESGQLNTALIGITLKQEPAGLPPTMTSLWINGGQLHAEAPELAEIA